MSSNRPSILNTDFLRWGVSAETEQQHFPEWAEFLFEVGSWIAGLGDTGGRLFCTVLLPSRILASALAAFGALSNSLSDPSDGMPWESFLEWEPGTHVYFLYDLPKKGKRQLEGTLGDVENYGNEFLRKIHVEAKRKEHKNLSISLSKSKYKEANVSLHPQHRAALLNDLKDLSTAYPQVFSTFNENRLLLSDEECVIVTNRAAWEREIETLFLSSQPDSGSRYLLSELLMLKYGRVKLCSPRNRSIECFDTELAILDGIDALRSRENIRSTNSLILLDKNEYQEEAQDMIYSLSDYCDRDGSVENIKPNFSCPEGIEMQFYFFSGKSK